MIAVFILNLAPQAKKPHDSGFFTERAMKAGFE